MSSCHRAALSPIGEPAGLPPVVSHEEWLVARKQLLAYPTVSWIEGAAVEARPVGEGFRVTLASGEALEGSRLVLATGVVDTLPDVPGLAAHWGVNLFQCPYCHGYELNMGRIGVIAVGPNSIHQAQLLAEWGTVTFFTRGLVPLDEAQLADLAARGVTIDDGAIAEIEADAPTVVLADGRRLPMDGLFTIPDMQVAGPLAEQLGCAFDSNPLGTYIRVDDFKQTTVPGVFACGDAVRLAGSVSLAVGDGAMAGVAAHRSLIFR